MNSMDLPICTKKKTTTKRTLIPAVYRETGHSGSIFIKTQEEQLYVRPFFIIELVNSGAKKRGYLGTHLPVVWLVNPVTLDKRNAYSGLVIQRVYAACWHRRFVF